MLVVKNILHVEDEAYIANMVRLVVSGLYSVEIDNCAKGEEAIKMLSDKDYDVILMDIGLKGDIDGIETTKKIKEMKPNQVVIVCSGHDKVPYNLFDGNWPKPIVIDQLEKVLKPLGMSLRKVNG